MNADIEIEREGRRIILLDLDGVLLDNDQYDEQWERLAPSAFVPRLGGDPKGWARAQDTAWRQVEDRANQRLRELPPGSRPAPAQWWDQANSDWIHETCRLMGVKAPDTVQERVEAAEHALRVYFENTNAVFSGVGEALATLADRFALHMASGNPTLVVESVLKQIGARSLIGRAFGSDLLGSYKLDGERFYEAILASIGVSGGDVIVVDDLEEPLRAARAVGAATVKVGGNSASCDLVIDSLVDLPRQIGLVL